MFIETKKELRAELENAELRATTHLRKLQKIERILEQSEENKELYKMTIDKIKRALANDYQSNN